MSLDVPMRFDDVPLLWTVDDVLSPDECEQSIRFIEAANPRLATNNALFRDQDRVMKDDPALASRVLGRLRAHLPDTIGGHGLLRINERFRFYRYRRGQRFAPHMDHWYRPNHRSISLLSIVIYLNDEFSGGETRFMEQLERTVVPAIGLAAVFQHKIRHEGCVVTRGVKYAVRTDVIYGE